MLVKLLSNQIPTYELVIRDAIEKSMPDFEDSIKTELFKELLLDVAQCWISYKNDKFEAVLITQIRKDIAVGVNALTILGVHAPNGTVIDSFISGLSTVQGFAKVNNCTVVDFYSSNPELIKYARQFDIKWETTYFQLSLNAGVIKEK